MGKKNCVDPAMFKHRYLVISFLIRLILRCPRDWLFLNAQSSHPKAKIRYSGELEEESEIEVYDGCWYRDATCVEITWHKGNNTQIKYVKGRGWGSSLEKKTLTNCDPLVNCFSSGEVLLYLRECQVFDVPDFSSYQKIAVSDYINAYLKWLTGFERYESMAERYIGEKTPRGYIEQRDVTVYPLELLDEVIKIWAYVILNSNFLEYVMKEFGRAPKKYRKKCFKKYEETKEEVVNARHNVQILKWRLEEAEAALAMYKHLANDANNELKICLRAQEKQ